MDGGKKFKITEKGGAGRERRVSERRERREGRERRESKGEKGEKGDKLSLNKRELSAII